ncbi:MAG TPA: hypothetical protein PLI95_30140, partial [Polyangiaceae bacterium]|nr:hypothetical protein [Polyangiaceae bacterium]
MGLIYLAALIIGLGTQVLQFVMAHAGGGDAGHELEVHDGAEHDISHAETESGIGGTAALFLSLRFWTFGLMAFGMVGASIHYLKLAGVLVSATLSGVFGIACGLLAAAVFRNLTRGVSSS